MLSQFKIFWILFYLQQNKICVENYLQLSAIYTAVNILLVGYTTTSLILFLSFATSSMSVLLKIHPAFNIAQTTTSSHCSQSTDWTAENKINLR